MTDERLMQHMMDIILNANARGYFNEKPNDKDVEKSEKAKARELVEFVHQRYYSDIPP